MAFFRKDASLDALADTYNVAQFVSFAPIAGVPEQQYSRVNGYIANHSFGSLEFAIEALLSACNSGTINIRSYNAEEMQSREFLYGLSDIDTIRGHVRRHIQEGAFVILNETIDVSDGGVSGVVMGDIVEFRPDATPRGVEKPGFASLPREFAEQLLQAVYGFEVKFPDLGASRVEFSVHPIRRGWKNSHLIFWEYEELAEVQAVPSSITWPNDFSRLLGDKVYGLLIGWFVGAKVPLTQVFSRRVAPFAFGAPTLTGEVWMRTCPTEQVPGKYSTTFGWSDPYKLMSLEDPGHEAIASVISQHSVDAVWSGAALEDASGELLVEGVRGFGDGFMQGVELPQDVPTEVIDLVSELKNFLWQALGPVRFEWAFDGSEVWLLQLHTGRSVSTSSVIVPGDAHRWFVFDIALGLEQLRLFIEKLDIGDGITFTRHVGTTSHMADVVRKAGIPTRITNES